MPQNGQIDAGKALALIESMAGVRVLVAGDIMLDRFVYGDVERISPESPVPVLSLKRETGMLGGAGNVLSNLAGLGARPLIVSLVGDDAEGERLAVLVEGLGGPAEGLIRDPARPTIVKTRYIAGHQQLLRCDSEKIGEPGAAIEAALVAKIREYAAQSAAIVLSDYGKGAASPAVIRAALDSAKARGLPVLVDPKGSDFSRYAGATLATPNRRELSLACGGAQTGSDSEVEAAGRAVLERSGIGALIVTRSQDGMTVLEGAGGGQSGAAPAVHIRSAAREVYDVSGAGDTVIAVAAAALACGAGLPEAAALANLAAGIVVGKLGTAPVNACELKAALASAGGYGENGNPAFRSPLAAGREEAARLAAGWRSQGLKVGFTNGCFDIIHAGHVSYLREARSKCDRLVVGINADASVRRLKGQSRPVNGERNRAEVLGALACVDLVVLFGNEADERDLPVKLIEALKPDVHFKGGDYRAEDLPETPIVLAGGGKVEILGMVEGQSTTGMIDRMKGR